MKRKILSLLLCNVILMGLFSMNVFATSNLNHDELALRCPYKELAEIIALEEGETLEINGTKNPLFWEFKDYDNSFNDILKYDSKTFTEIALENNLETINKDNWKLYYEQFKNSYNVNEYDQLDKQTKILHQFFVVCKNHEKNEQIMEIYNESSYDLNELICYLPYTSPIVEKIKFTNAADYVTPRATSISNAVAYARKYAKNENTNYKYYQNADCTNFVSQIIKAGGRSENSTWCKYTRAWNNAHYFTMYWYMESGANNGFPSFNSISAQLKAGDVISVDYEKDGDYDHLGFVVASGPKTSSGYYDVEIAQHSDDYCLKVSSSNNNWEKTSGLFVRLRML